MISSWKVTATATERARCWKMNVGGLYARALHGWWHEIIAFPIRLRTILIYDSSSLSFLGGLSYDGSRSCTEDPFAGHSGPYVWHATPNKIVNST